MRWLDDRLGRARDLDVLIETLEKRAAEASSNGAPSVEQLEQLHVEREERHAEVRAALREPRYVSLLEDVVGAARTPQFTGDAERPARKTARKLIRKVWRRARRRVREHERSPTERTLHQVRTKAKHVRYAAECFGPLAGKRVKKLARRAECLQTLLGDHRDATCRCSTHACRTAPGAQLETHVEEDEASIRPLVIDSSCHAERSAPVSTKV